MKYSYQSIDSMSNNEIKTFNSNKLFNKIILFLLFLFFIYFNFINLNYFNNGILKNNNLKNNFDLNGRYILENYNIQSPFSSFLPGISGLWGIPM